MAKLQDMFTQARRAQGGSGIGFLGKNRGETRPRAAAVVLELTKITAGDVEAAVKAGADGLLFQWDGKDTSFLETVKNEIESARAVNADLICGLAFTSGWDTLDRERFTELKEDGIQYIVLPLHAPARLVALESKDVELVISVPMRSGDLYPIFIRNLTAFDSIAGVVLDFGLTGEIGTMTIEDVLQYRAVREAVRFPALVNVKAEMSEADAYTLIALGIQALVLTKDSVDESTRQQIQELRSLLEKVYQEEKETSVRRP